MCGADGTVVVQTENAHVTVTRETVWPITVWVLLVTAEMPRWSAGYFPEAARARLEPDRDCDRLRVQNTHRYTTRDQTSNAKMP